MALVVRKHRESQQAQGALMYNAGNYVSWQQCVQHTELPEASGIGLKRLCCL